MSVESSLNARRNSLRVFEDSKIGAKHLDLTETFNTLKKELESKPVYKNLADYEANINNVEYDASKELRGTERYDLSLANMKPRLRMTALYQIAQQHNYLVVGTSNAAEIFLGYFTK